MDGRRRKTVHAARRPEERPKDASHSSTFTECTAAMLTLPSFAGPTSARSVTRTVRMRFSVGTADTEALQERGRRLGREAGEVLVVRRDFLSQGKPATGKRPEGVLGGCGGRVERARSEGGAAREQTVIGQVE